MVLENIFSQEIVQKLGWTLLHFVWQAMAAAAILAILLAGLRKATANVRYIIACSALGLIVLLPLVTIHLVPVSSSLPTAGIETPPVTAIVPVQPAEEMPLAPILEHQEPLRPESINIPPTVSWKHRTVKRLEPILPYIVTGWLLGVFGFSAWHLGGWAQLQRLRKKLTRPVDASLYAALMQLARKLGVNRVVEPLESALVQVPTVIGWLRPVILLPAAALTGLNTEQLQALLAHELAHIRRYDYLVNMLQTLVETLGFYHPAVWWISHKIRIERENCCDDLAVSVAGNRILYARALTSMEEIRAGRSALAVAATGGNLFARIHRLLSRDSADCNWAGWMTAAVSILLIGIIVVPATLALTDGKPTEYSTKILLDKMLEHRSRVKNLKYVAENQIWQTTDPTDDLIKSLQDQIKRRREEGASERDIGITERTIEQLKAKKGRSEGPQINYEILKCTIDSEGRSKIERTGGTYDSSGKKVSSGDRQTWAWNGIIETELAQRDRTPANAIIRNKPNISIAIGHPWRSFTGIFCRFLEETLEAGGPVSIEQLKDGTCRVGFDYKTSRYIATVDPSQSYTCSLQETYNKQKQRISRSTATYKEVTEDIWFPISGQVEIYAADGSLQRKYTYTSTQIKVNDPTFNSSGFDVNMPEGASVRDETQGKQYIVGSKRVHDLDKPQKTSTETQEVDPNAWQEKFYSIYKLEEGQVLKRIAPPFIPERSEYFKFVQPGRYSANTPHEFVNQYFNWDGTLSIKGASVGGGIRRLKSTLESVIGLGNREYDIPPEILGADMSGDWIVRKDTQQEELLKSLEQIIKEETGKDIDFVKQKVETEVIFVKGKYSFQSLPNITDGKYVLISTNKTDTYTGGGGGSGTLAKFLQWVGNRVGMNVVNETETEGIELSWRNHVSSELIRLDHNDPRYNQQLDLLLKNLSLQTGLVFDIKPARVEKWFVVQGGSTQNKNETAFGDEHEMVQLENAATEPDKLPAPGERLITNQWIDCDLALEVLPTIARQANVVIIPDDTVVGLVTVKLEKVPVDKALEIVLAGTNYVFKKTPYYYVVASRGLNKAVEPNKVVLKLVDPNSQPVVGAWVGTYVDWSDIAESPPIWHLNDGGSYKASEIDRAAKVISDKEGKITLTKEELFKAEWPAERTVPLTAIDEGHYLAGLRSLSRDDLGKEVTLTMQPSCRVRGRVTAATARKHKWSTKLLSVLVYWETSMPCYQYTSKQGRFEFVLPPGMYAARVYAEHADNSVIIPIPIQPGQRELDLTKYLDGTSTFPAVNSNVKYIRASQDGYERIPLEHSEAGEMAKRLNEVIQQMPGTELQRGVMIQPLIMEKCIGVFGRKDLRDMVKKLFVEMDVPAWTFVTKVFLLKYADADEVKKNIGAFYGRMTDTVKVISFPELQQVTVIASRENMLKIERQIAEWDVPLDKERIRPQIFTLRNSDPAQMANLLTKLFAEESKQAVDMYEVLFGKDAEEKRNAVGPRRYQLTFEYVPGTKKIIVISNFPKAYDIIERLILELDKQQIATKDIKEVREWIGEWIEQLDGSGTTKNEHETILLEVSIYTVSDAFLKDVGLDPNTLEGPEWANPPKSPTGEPFAFVLDEFNVDSLLKDVRARKDCRILSAPKFIVMDDKQVQTAVVSQTHYITGVWEPNGPPDAPPAKPEKLQFGTFMKLRPKLAADTKNITLALDIGRRVANPEEHKHNGEYSNQLPGVVTSHSTIVVQIPNGETLPMVGQRIAQPALLTSQEASRQEALWSMRPLWSGIYQQSPIVAEKPGRLLILVQPTIPRK